MLPKISVTAISIYLASEISRFCFISVFIHTGARVLHVHTIVLFNWVNNNNHGNDLSDTFCSGVNRSFFDDTVPEGPPFNLTFCCDGDFWLDRFLHVVSIHYAIILSGVFSTIFPTLSEAQSKLASGIFVLIPTCVGRIYLLQNNEPAN